MRCATASRPTCSSTVPIFVKSKRFWVTTNWTRQRATPVSPPADRRHREPARPAVAAAQEAQEEQEGPAAGVTTRGHVSPRAGGRGYLPRPRGGVAQSQRRTRQPRPDEGHECDRVLPHGGPRRALLRAARTR